MRLLLDTHALLWWWNRDRRLSASGAEMIAQPNAIVHVSAVTAWEIATKKRVGRLPELRRAIDEFLPFVEDEGFELLSVSPEHALRAGSYDVAHADPFDRLLAAQSELDGLPLVTRDPAFAAFPCETRW